MRLGTLSESTSMVFILILQTNQMEIRVVLMICGNGETVYSPSPWIRCLGLAACNWHSAKWQQHQKRTGAFRQGRIHKAQPRTVQLCKVDQVYA